MSDIDKIHVLSRAVIIDEGKIFLCKTLDLEVSFYFLPGGHIKNGESAKTSLFRELKEETGFEVEIGEFLGCLEYRFEPGYSSICHNHEYNFIFEAKSKDLRSRKMVVCPEKHIELVWMNVESLEKIDFRAEPLKQLIPRWLKGDGQQFASEMI